MPDTVESRQEVLSCLRELDRAFRDRDVDRALSLFAQDSSTILVGSEAGETAKGPKELRAFFEQLFTGPITYGYHWEEIDVEVAGDFAWAFANGRIETISAAGSHDHPYRVTAILRRTGNRWLWMHYHGSEPAG